MKGWGGALPAAVTLGAEKLAHGEGYVAAVQSGVLILQALCPVKENVRIVIPDNGDR